MDSDTVPAANPALPPILLAAVATALWCFVFAKAGLAAITHDEASTYFHHQNSNFITCLYSPDCWKSANNHLLNTLFWQQSIRWLGPTELGMRLPNVLGYLIFLAGSAFLVLRLNAGVWQGLAAFAILNFNPYLIDFFALARGYGLCAGFIMAALTLWYLYWQTRRTVYLACTGAALTAAVLSNFVALNVFIAVAGATLLLTIGKDRKLFLRSAAVLGINASLLALIVHRPIRFLRQGGEFQYGSGSLWESLESLIKNPVYGNAYLGKATLPVFCGIAYGVFVLALLYALLRLRRAGPSGRDLFLAASGLAFALSIAVMIAQHYLLGSVYLVNRTATPLMPLFAVVPAIALLLAGANKRWAAVLSALVCFALAWNLMRAANVRYFREWWYDENTKSVMLYLNDVGNARQKPVRAAVSWLFYPSGEFYRHTLSLPYVESLPGVPDIRPDAGYDYYYIEESQKDMLGDAYEQEKYYPWGRVLMRKKALPAGGVAQ